MSFQNFLNVIFFGSLQVIAARHLPNPDHIISPFVQVELWPYTGSQADDYSFKTTMFSKKVEKRVIERKKMF